MTNVELEVACARAVAKLLLGPNNLNSKVIILAGDQLNAESRRELTMHSTDNDTDIIHLAFISQKDPGMMNLTLFVLNEGHCSIRRNCRLFMPSRSERGAIISHFHTCGYFSVGPDGVMRIDECVAANPSEGMARADAWLTNEVIGMRAVSAEDQWRTFVRSKSGVCA